MNVARRPAAAQPPPPSRGDALLASLEALAAEDARRRRLLTHAVFAAALLHVALALLVPRPETRTASAVETARELFRVLPTPRIVTTPPAVEIRSPRARRVPVPDPTPAEPEPLRALEPPPVELPLALDAELGAVPAAPPPLVETPVVHRVGGEVVAPVKLFAPAPEYPEVARRIRKEGAVVLRLRLDAAGTIVAIEPLTSLGFRLEEAAVAAVSKWRFEPATLRGRPVAVDYHLTVRFSLSD